MEPHLSKFWDQESSSCKPIVKIFCKVLMYTKLPMDLIKHQNWRSDYQTRWTNGIRVSEVPLRVSFVESLLLFGGGGGLCHCRCFHHALSSLLFVTCHHRTSDGKTCATWLNILQTGPHPCLLQS